MDLKIYRVFMNNIRMAHLRSTADAVISDEFVVDIDKYIVKLDSTILFSNNLPKVVHAGDNGKHDVYDIHID